MIWLQEQGVDAANVIWATGHRLDHTVNNLAMLAKFKTMKLVLYDDHSKAYLLPQQFKKQFSAGDILSLIPMGKVTSITTSNLMYPMNGESLELGGRSGTSNEVVKDGLVSIHYQSGELILLESTDEVIR